VDLEDQEVEEVEEVAEDNLPFNLPRCKHNS
jgi:hypothetical protein